MVTAGIAILMGAILACFQQQSIDIYWVSLLPLCLFFIYFHPPGRVFWLLAASFLYTSLHIHFQLAQRADLSDVKQRVTLRGEIVDIPRYRGDRARFIFNAQTQDSTLLAAPLRLRLSWRNPTQPLAAGQQWSLRVRYKPAHGYQNAGGFDYERWLFVKGIAATGYVVTDTDNRLLGDDHWNVNRMRQRINQWILTHCEQCRYSGLLLALSTGYRGELRDSERKLFQTTGTAHLIAISGLHVGVIGGFAFWLAGKLWNLMLYSTRLNRRQFAWSVSWMVVLIYSMLAGFDLPTQRAFLMFSVLGVLLILRLPVNLLHSVMTTLVAVLVFFPLAVLSESFWLTLSAMGIILLGNFVLHNERSRWRQLLIIQLLFSLLFIPLTMLIFGQIHSASLFANLIAVPLVSLIIVPLDFMLLLCFALPDSWLNIAYSLMDSLCGLLMAYLHLLQQLGLQALQTPPLNSWQLLLLVILLLLFVLPRGLIRMRAWLALLPVVLLWPAADDHDVALSATVLDVGTGNAVVVRTRHHSLVYDFGPGNRSGYSTGEWAILPYLRSQGIRRLDRIVISHTDQDHFGGIYSVVDQFADVPVFSGTAHSLAQQLPEIKSIRSCHQTAPWRWDGVEFEFLSTPYKSQESDNNRSCVLRISYQQHSILLAGDIEASQEQALLERYGERLASEVVLAPHHGSSTSSSLPFIQAIAPRHVVFSSGYLNHWRFPRTQIIARYRRLKAALYQTDRDGAVQIECDRDACQVEKFRQRYPHIWY